MPLRDALNPSEVLDRPDRCVNSSPLCGLPLLIAKMLISPLEASGDKEGEPCSLSLSGQSLVRASGGLLKEGSAYVTLQRMQKRGLVASRREIPANDSTSVIVNRLYTLTPAGVAALLFTQAAEKTKKARAA